LTERSSVFTLQANSWHAEDPLFKHKWLSLSLIVVSLLTVSACVAVPSAPLPAQPPGASRTSDQQPVPSMKAAGTLAEQARAGVSTPDPGLSSSPTGVMEVTELPSLEPSAWKGDLRDLPPGKSEHRLKEQEGEPAAGAVTEAEREEEETLPLPVRAPVPDTVAQMEAPAAAMPSPLSSFAGLTFSTWGDGGPPDTNGDVGPVYYIQTVNTSVGIFNKSTGALVSAFSFDSLMKQGFASTHPCYSLNYGDPVVVWDPAADRWFITDFAFASTTAPPHL
jgi:hypothetical protein